MVMRRFRVGQLERGYLFERGEFVRTLMPGTHWVLDPLRRVRVDLLSVREVEIRHEALDVLVKRGAFGADAEVVDLKDHERAIVWADGRFHTVLGPGLHALFTAFHEVKVERVDARGARVTHPALPLILGARRKAAPVEVVKVDPGQVALFFLEGSHQANLGPGVHAFWQGVGELKVTKVELRQQVLEVPGQEIMTADKVTLRLNAVVAYQVVDALKAATVVDDAKQALYREAQLALRATIGARDLDALLGEKDAVARELETTVRARVEPYGLAVVALGIKDVILPGDMKELLNKVTEAKKAAEAELVTRREETAAMRSQANTAKILEGSPTLMRLRELEVLEKVANKANLTVVLGEQGLTDRVVKLL